VFVRYAKKLHKAHLACFGIYAALVGERAASTTISELVNHRSRRKIMQAGRDIKNRVAGNNITICCLVPPSSTVGLMV
jgi:hypothetical protein